MVVMVGAQNSSQGLGRAKRPDSSGPIMQGTGEPRDHGRAVDPVPRSCMVVVGEMTQ